MMLLLVCVCVWTPNDFGVVIIIDGRRKQKHYDKAFPSKYVFWFHVTTTYTALKRISRTNQIRPIIVRN